MPTRTEANILKNYQRKWREYSVDKNLRDDWLERINSLKILEVLSICEGHYTFDQTHSWIKFCVKDDFYEKFVNYFQDEIVLLDTLNNYISSEICYYCEIIKGISNDTKSSNFGIIKEVKMSFVSNRPRMSADFTDIDFSWFENTVLTVEKIDGALFKIIGD